MHAEKLTFSPYAIHLEYMRNLITLFIAIALFFISCRTAEHQIDRLPATSVVPSCSVSDSAYNIRVVINIDTTIASTPQDVFLYTSYCGNTYLLDSVRTDGSTTLKLKWYIPFQNEA